MHHEYLIYILHDITLRFVCRVKNKKYLNNVTWSLILKTAGEEFVFESLFRFLVIFQILYSLGWFLSLFFIQRPKSAEFACGSLQRINVRNLKCFCIWGCFLTVAAQQTFFQRVFIFRVTMLKWLLLSTSTHCTATLHVQCTHLE